MSSKGGYLNAVTISLRSVLDTINSQMPNTVDVSKDFLVLVLRPIHIRDDDQIVEHETALATLLTNTLGERLSVSKVQGSYNQTELANIPIDDNSLTGKVVVLYGGIPRSDELASVVNGVVDFSKIPIVPGDDNDNRLTVPTDQTSGIITGVANESMGGLG